MSKDEKPKKPEPDESNEKLTGEIEDAFEGSMPSVTKLLYRNNLEAEIKNKKGTKQPSQVSTVTTAPPAPKSKAAVATSTGIAISETAPESLEMPEPDAVVDENPKKLDIPDAVATTEPVPEAQPEPQPSKVPVLKPAKRKPPRAQLIRWDLATLKTGTDPLAKGLADLFQSGQVNAALFLSILPPPEGSPAPHFMSTAAVNPQGRSRLWAGLKWDPSLTPMVWNAIVKTASAELPPPGTSTNLQSSRNVTRSSFGVEPEEWLMLVRVGTPQNCRGILVILSKVSLIAEVQKNLQLFQTPLTSKAA